MALPYSGELPKTGARFFCFAPTLQTRIIVKNTIQAATTLSILTHVIVIKQIHTH